MKNLLLCWILLCSNVVIAQSPELVIDVIPGESYLFSDFGISRATINDNFVVTIDSEEIGRELAIISGDEIEIVDLVEGEEESFAREITPYQDHIYFSALDDNSIGRLYKTDGTLDGISIVELPIEETSLPKSFITTNSGKLYFSYGNNIIQYNGIDALVVGPGSLDATESRFYCQYKDEIAFLVQNNNDQIELYTIVNDTTTLLYTTDFELSFFGDYYGLSTVSNGLMFSIEGDNGGNNGTYIFNESTNTLSTISIPGTQPYFRTIVDINEDLALTWAQEAGYYLTNGREGEEIRLHASDHFSGTQGDTLVYATYGDNVLLYAEEDVFGDDFLVFYNGTTGDVTNLGEVQSFHSNLIMHNNFALISFGTSNGFSPDLYAVNMETGEFDKIYEFDEPSNNTRSIFLLGVIGTDLYFNSNLDPTVGRELYSLDISLTDVVSSTIEVTEQKFAVQQYANGIEVTSDETLPVNVAAYDLSGRFIRQYDSVTNNLIHINNGIPVSVLKINVDGEVQTLKFSNN